MMGRLCNENGLSVLRQLVYQLIGQSASSLLHAEEHESSQAHVYNSMFILLEITTGSQNRGFKGFLNRWLLLWTCVPLIIHLLSKF